MNPVYPLQLCWAEGIINVVLFGIKDCKYLILTIKLKSFLYVRPVDIFLIYDTVIAISPRCESSGGFVVLRKVNKYYWESPIMRHNWRMLWLSAELVNIYGEYMCNQNMMTSSNGTLCVTGPLWGEPPIADGFPKQRPVTQSFDVFFDLRLNKQLSKQSRCWSFETHHVHYDISV